MRSEQTVGLWSAWPVSGLDGWSCGGPVVGWESESILRLFDALAGEVIRVITWFKHNQVRKITKKLISDRLP